MRSDEGQLPFSVRDATGEDGGRGNLTSWGGGMRRWIKDRSSGYGKGRLGGSRGLGARRLPPYLSTRGAVWRQREWQSLGAPMLLLCSWRSSCYAMHQRGAVARATLQLRSRGHAAPIPFTNINITKYKTMTNLSDLDPDEAASRHDGPGGGRRPRQPASVPVT